ncbi:DNA polymerase III subunit beta [Candidatus Saccharibacteria bacterium]|nr:DNA polymerase III subunit beta [Candidatus Saccharibacteria bacterium]
MKIKVTQEKLNKALTCVSRIAANKSTLPILNNILIRVDNKKVSLITTNLDMAIVDYLPVSESENGVITVPAKLLTEFISNLPKGETVEISSNDTKVLIKAGKYSSTINGALADDFPELPEIDEKNAVVFKIGAEEFKSSISQVIIASSNDLTRPALTGLYFDTNDGSLFAVSTDGYRLAKKELIKKVESEVKAIVPSSTLHEVLRTISDDVDDIEISFNEDLVQFRLGETEIVSKLIDASYPNYTALIPKNNDTKVILDRDELIRTIKLAALFARSVDGSIVCEAKAPETFSVKSIANEFGENDSSLQTSVEKDSKTRLNSRFFIDALNSIYSKEIVMEFSSNVKPILVYGKNDNTYIHIIMPLNK